MKSSPYFRIFLYVNNTVFAAIFFYWLLLVIAIGSAIWGEEIATLTPPRVKVKNLPINGKTLLIKETEGAERIVVNKVDSLDASYFSTQLKLDLNKVYHLNKGYAIFDIVRWLLAFLAMLMALYSSFLALDDIRKGKDSTNGWAKRFKRAGWLFFIAALLLAFGLEYSAFFQNNGKELLIWQSNFHLINVPAAVCLMVSFFFWLIAAIKPANA